MVVKIIVHRVDDTPRTLGSSGTYRLSGHLFQGRYKAIPIEAERAEYFRSASDYIHLNPARAGLLNAAKPDLLSYAWSSVPLFVQRAFLPAWLRRERVFGSVKLPDEGAGSRRRYRAWMARSTQEVLEWKEAADQAQEWRKLQRGWFLGSDTFRDRLMDRAAAVVGGRKRRSYRGEGLRAHDEKEAGRLLAAGLARLGLTQATVSSLKKSDPRKQALAWLIKTRSVVSDEWLGGQLRMGDRSNISRAVSAFQTPATRERQKLKKLLHTCTDWASPDCSDSELGINLGLPRFFGQWFRTNSYGLFV